MHKKNKLKKSRFYFFTHPKLRMIPWLQREALKDYFSSIFLVRRTSFSLKNSWNVNEIFATIELNMNNFQVPSLDYFCLIFLQNAWTTMRRHEEIFLVITTFTNSSQRFLRRCCYHVNIDVLILLFFWMTNLLWRAILNENIRHLTFQFSSLSKWNWLFLHCVSLPSKTRAGKTTASSIQCLAFSP